MTTLAAAVSVGGPAGRTRSPGPPPAPRLEGLPRDVLLRVLSLLSYEEVCGTRAACRTLARAAEEVLVRAFDAFGARLLRRLRELRLSPDFSFHTCLICKTLYLIEIEYRLLRAAVGVYVRECSAPFVGGRILDLLEHALALSSPPFPMPDDDVTPPPKTGVRAFTNLFTPDIVDELSRLVERYICFFENEVEPRLRSPTPLGVKLVDVLDAFTGACSDVELRTQGGWRSLRARYHLPLTGLLFHDEDTGLCSRVTVPESEASSLLAALREAARKSGQRYVSALLQRELAATETRRSSAHFGLFGVRRRCVARDRLLAVGVGGLGAGGGAVQRERLERRPLRSQPPPERDGAADTLCLRAALRIRFLLNQRPLEADCLGVPLDEDEVRGGVSDPGRWGWEEEGSSGAPPPSLPLPDAGPPDLADDPRTSFWFQLEVHRQQPHTSPTLDGPVPSLGPVVGPRRRLSFQPARFSRMRLSGSRDGGQRGGGGGGGKGGGGGGACESGGSDTSAASVGSGRRGPGTGNCAGGGTGYIGSAMSVLLELVPLDQVSLRDVCVSYALPMPPRPCEARIAVTYGRLRRTSGTAGAEFEGAEEVPPSASTLDAARALGALEALEAVDAIGALRSARDGEDSGLAKLRSTLAAVSSGGKQTRAPVGDPVAAAAAILLKDSRVDELSRRVSEVLGAEAALLTRAHRQQQMHEEWRSD